jgi:hypothetical protein
VPGGNRATVDRLDDQATQLSATAAQPEAGIDDQDASLSGVESVVSPEGIEPARPRPKAEGRVTDDFRAN